MRLWRVFCQNYENSLQDCRLSTPYWCPRKPVISCSKKPFDKRVCRQHNTVPCSSGVCGYKVPCVNGDGRVISKRHSYCKHCPVSFYGNGKTCHGRSSMVLSSLRSIFEAQIDLHLFLDQQDFSDSECTV